MTIQNLISEAEQLARDLGISAGQLHQRVGVNASNWTRWKQGSHKPSLSSFQALQGVVEQLRQEKQSGTQDDRSPTAEHSE